MVREANDEARLAQSARSAQSVTAYRALASAHRVSILHVLQQEDRALTLTEVAGATSLAESTARDHLHHLIAAGFVTKAPEDRATRGRPRMLYRSVERAALRDADEWFRSALLTVLLEGYGKRLGSRSAAAAAAGEALGEAKAAVTAGSARAGHAPAPGEDPALPQMAALEAHLEDLRFAPEVDADGDRVHLRHCPFLDLARSNTEVVCSVHLGVARGVLSAAGGPVTAEALDPFVGPDHCVLRLGRRDTGAARRA